MHAPTDLCRLGFAWLKCNWPHKNRPSKIPPIILTGKELAAVGMRGHLGCVDKSNCVIVIGFSLFCFCWVSYSESVPKKAPSSPQRVDDREYVHKFNKTKPQCEPALWPSYFSSVLFFFVCELYFVLFFLLLFLYMWQVILYKVFSLLCALSVTRRKPSQAHHFIRGTLALILHLCTWHWLRVLCFQPWKKKQHKKQGCSPSAYSSQQGHTGGHFAWLIMWPALQIRSLNERFQLIAYYASLTDT